jgi:hypothetical protein
VRRVTLNVGRVSAVELGKITLQQPLAGGAPQPGARVQKVVAFAERDGGSFFQEWSALFVIESEAGARLVLNYPRLQVSAPAQETSVEVATPLEAILLHASFVALPQVDEQSGEPVLCYRTWVPAARSAVY